MKIIKIFLGENVNFLYEVLNYKNFKKLGIFDFLEKIKNFNDKKIYEIIFDFLKNFKFILENKNIISEHFINLFTKLIIPKLKNFQKILFLENSKKKKSIEILSVNSNSQFSDFENSEKKKKKIYKKN